MKTIDPDDPRITAYAIGELDAADLAEVEALLKESPEARAEVDAVRETVAVLEKELGSTDGESFSEEEREEVLAAGKVVTPGPDAFSRFSRRLGLVGVAACLVGVGTVGIRQMMDQDKAYMDEALEAGESVVGATPAPAAAVAQNAGYAPSEELAEASADPDNADPSGAAAGLGRVSLDSPSEDAAAPRMTEKEKMLSKDPSSFANAEKDAEGFAAGAATFANPMPTSRAAEMRRQVGKYDDARAKRAEAMPSVAASPAKAAPDLLANAGSVPAAAEPPVPADGFGGDGAFGDGLAPAESEAKRRASKAEGVELSKKLVGRELGDESRGRRRIAPMPEPEPRGPTPVPPPRSFDGEAYGALTDTPFVRAIDDPLSTFAIDVDTGSYTNIRRFLGRRGQLPPKDAVRVEEMINYFDYDYAEPEGDHPFALDVDIASCPWAVGHRLVRVALKGKSMETDERPPSTLVFLVDVSGSMRSDDKLALLKESLVALVRALSEDDRIAIVTYAGQARVAMEPRHGDEKEAIIDAIDALRAGGSTNGGDGINMAYKIARENFVEGGTNRVVLATDGDFNVGTTNTDALIEAVKGFAAKDKIGLTVLGFGEGNLKEARMEQIANKGDGNYFYIDCKREGRRVLVDKLSATLVTIAKNVKVQVDFNPAKVHSYRLIGYANRRMPDIDFRDDTKDAGEIGAGHTVTALYEIVPVGAERPPVPVSEPKSRYIKEAVEAEEEREPAPKLVGGDELLTAMLRYKAPDAGPKDKATEFEQSLKEDGQLWADAGDDFRFAAAVAAFGMQLRQSPYKGAVNCDLVLELAEASFGDDPNGLRAEFVELVNRAKSLEPLRRIRE